MKKYFAIYFDLDDTLVWDNPVTGSSELLESGLEKYRELKKEYPDVPFKLLTQRLQSEIKYPDVYSFDDVIGRDDMQRFVESLDVHIPFKCWLNPLNWYRYVWGKKMFKEGSTHKVWYLFLRHTIKGERVLIVDDDLRVSRVYR